MSRSRNRVKYSIILMDIIKDLKKKFLELDVGEEVFKIATSRLGINLNHKSLSFINFFKLMDILDLEVEMTFKLKRKHGKSVLYETDGDKLKVTEINEETKL